MLACLTLVLAEQETLPAHCAKMQVRSLMQGLEAKSYAMEQRQPLLVHCSKIPERPLMQGLEAKLHPPQSSPVLASCKDAQRCEQQVAVDAKLNNVIL